MVRVGSLIDGVFSSLPFRKAYHFAGGLLLFLGVCFLSDAGIYAAGAVYLLGFLAFGRRVSFAVIGVLLLFLLTRSRFATLAAIVVFTLGDGLAAVIGSQYGWRRLPWNGDKTTAGSAAFLASSSAGLFLYLSSIAGISGWEKALLALVPSLSACALESLPLSVIRDRKPDDNLAILLAAGLIVFLLGRLLGIPDTPQWLPGA